MAVHRHRVHTLFAGVLVALAMLVATAPAATAAAPGATPTTPPINRTDAAAGWLARQLVDGERFEVVFDGVAYPDQGLTIDTNAAKATDRLARPEILTGYTGDGTEAYAGATAKAALAAQVRGRNPADFGGIDLIARSFLLTLQVGCSGATQDRGAIAYTTAGFDPSTAPRATAQAVPGLAGAGLASLTATGSRPADPVPACR